MEIRDKSRSKDKAAVSTSIFGVGVAMSNGKRTMKCFFVGDVALGDHPKSVGFGFYSHYKQGIPFSKAPTLFPHEIEADIIFGNLEFNIGAESLSGNDFSDLNCRGVSQYAEFLKKAGFTVLNMANNHIFQHGREEFNKTVQLLSSKNILVTGLKDGTGQSTMIRIGNQTIAFLAWSTRPRQGFACPPPYDEFNEETCYSEIVKAKTYADIVCVSLHWGEEFIEIPSDEERRIARSMIDSGAHIVVGHHPHVIREIEEYRGGLIAYSLGNFIGDMIWNTRTASTGLLYTEFTDGLLTAWKWYPAKIGKDYFPHYDPPASETMVSCYSKKNVRLNNKLNHISYHKLASHALNRHRFLTLLHMIRNFFKYDSEILYGIIRNAIKLRFLEYARKDLK